jgi:oxygen-dependent protoporphyrinogen oxidase
MNINLSDVDVVIIGAGLTGLTTAFYLEKSGKKVLLLEKSSRCGGVINTKEEKGFVFETGPNTGVIGNPEVKELFEDLGNSCILETAKSSAKKRLIWKFGTWYPLPSGPISALTTPLFSFYDKLRIFKEPFREKGTYPLETVAGIVRRRLGESFLNYAIAPFISGIYAGDPETLVTRYALPKMYNLEQDFGSLIIGGIKKSRLNKKDPRLRKATKEIFSAEGGLINLVKALRNKLSQQTLVTNAENVLIEKISTGYSTTFRVQDKEMRINSKFIITTTGTGSLSSLFTFIDEKKLSNIANLNYAKVVQVNLGYKHWTGMKLNAFGGLVPLIEKRDILGILFTSSFFKNRAPKNGALLSVFLGGTKKPDVFNLSDEQIKALALKEVSEMLQTSNIAPDLFHISRYLKGIAQYEASSRERLLNIELLENENPGLILAGSIRNGIGMADRIKQAKDIANQIIEKT